MEFRIVRPDGGIRTVHQIVEFVYDKDGNAITIYGTIQDITDKKKLEEDIAKIQKRFYSLVKISTDVFEILKPDGTIIYISEASSKVLGYTPEERIGRKVYDFYSCELQTSTARMINT